MHYQFEAPGLRRTVERSQSKVYTAQSWDGSYTAAAAARAGNTVGYTMRRCDVGLA